MIYIYFIREYEDIEIKFISEDLSEFKQYVESNYLEELISVLEKEL